MHSANRLIRLVRHLSRVQRRGPQLWGKAPLADDTPSSHNRLQRRPLRTLLTLVDGTPNRIEQVAG